MYLAIVLSTMLVLPGICWLVGGLLSPAAFSLVELGRWFLFWAMGVRLFVAGLRQVFQPSFTAEKIFEITDKKAFVVVQELGFANLSLGVLGLASFFVPGWQTAACLLGALFYGLAGINHVFKPKNATEWIAMVSDLYAAVLLVVFLFN